MRAIVMRQCGPPSVLTLEKDFPRPSAGKGEVLVQVVCTAVNPIDYKTRQGEFPPSFLTTKPKVRHVLLGTPYAWYQNGHCACQTRQTNPTVSLTHEEPACVCAFVCLHRACQQAGVAV